MLDPVALKVQALIPQPQIGTPSITCMPTYDAVRHTTIPALKIDQLLGSKQKISFYWSKTRTYAPLSPIYGNSEASLAHYGRRAVRSSAARWNG